MVLGILMNRENLDDSLVHVHGDWACHYPSIFVWGSELPSGIDGEIWSNFLKILLLLILEMLCNQYDFDFNLPLSFSLPINTSDVDTMQNTIGAT